MGGTVVLGSFSLNDLCSCPSPCSTCCSVSTVCCALNPTSRTLYATANISAFGCASQVVTLTYSDANLRWEGSGTFACGPGCAFTTTIQFRLACQDVGVGYLWYLVLSCDNFVASTTSNPTAITCSPFSLSFTQSTPATGCSGTCNANAMTITVTQ